MKFFQENLKETLKQKKVSQRKLAEKMGVSQMTVWEWLHRGAPSLERFCQICEVLDVEPNFLLTREGELEK